MKAYYDQTSLKDVQAMESELKANGFEVSISEVIAEIKREPSKYNKYLKWHITETFLATGGGASEYVKSKPEAIRKLTAPKRAMPIGEKMALTFLTIKEG